MIQAARLTPGSRFRLFKSVLYYSMRLMPYAWARQSITCIITKYINWLHPAPPADNTQKTRKRIDCAVASLQREGLVFLESLLSLSQITDILAFFEDKKVIWGHRSFLVNRAPDKSLFASYSLPDIIACPYILLLANNAEVLQIARAYLGCRPTISFLGLTWSFPSLSPGPTDDVQSFHRDPDDWRFLKLFVYLTDVDKESGPHELVRRSHRSSGRIFSKPYIKEEIEYRYGQDSLMKIIGPKGTTFLEDTWSIHKGHMPITRPRLLLQVEYSILPIMKFDYFPMPVPGSQLLDRYTNRLLII